VWHRIQPLVKELRLRENALLFENYEMLLPECRECYVPGIGLPSTRDDAAAAMPAIEEAPVCAIPQPRREVETIGRPMNGSTRGPESKQGSATTMKAESTLEAGQRIAPEFSLPDTDGIVHNLSEFTAQGPAVLVYARGAWCPYCLRQLADY